MEQFTRHYCGMVFRDHFRNMNGDEFQKFFGSIMNLRYPGDFTLTRPWGRVGDNKCDGYLPSQRKFYQCYAPNELAQNETIAKLSKDFTGALKYRDSYFDVWIFVHNARDGRIPTWLAFELDNLRTAHQDIQIETFGYWELHGEIFQLRQDQLVDLFGPLLGLQDVLAVEFRDVRPILNYIAINAPADDVIPRPVSPDKLKYNQLGRDIEECLRHGMIRADRVRTYLDQNADKELAARVAIAFREKYEGLRGEGLGADDIFYGLRVFTQGHFAQQPRTEGAVLAILAHLFEECDIFENPK